MSTPGGEEARGKRLKASCEDHRASRLRNARWGQIRRWFACKVVGRSSIRAEVSLALQERERKVAHQKVRGDGQSKLCSAVLLRNLAESKRRYKT